MTIGGSTWAKHAKSLPWLEILAQLLVAEQANRLKNLARTIFVVQNNGRNTKR